jgi:hypothetical protein
MGPPWHYLQALGCAFPDRQVSAARDVELHVGVCVAPAPYLQPAGNTSRQQGAARIEDRISAPFDEGLAGIGHPMPPAVFGQSDRLELNSYRPQGLLLDPVCIRRRGTFMGHLMLLLVEGLRHFRTQHPQRACGSVCHSFRNLLIS